MDDGDLKSLIDYLVERRTLLNTTIADLERLCDASPRKRAGRKSVAPEEREIISARMKARWANRRAAASQKAEHA